MATDIARTNVFKGCLVKHVHAHVIRVQMINNFNGLPHSAISSLQKFVMFA